MIKCSKKVVTFLFTLSFLLCFSQRSKKYYDSICDANYIDDSILYLRLKKEGRTVNYKKLTKKIIKDIKWDSLKKPNLIFSINSFKRLFNPMDHHPLGSCEFDKKSVNPNYSDTIFWSKKNIDFVVKTYKKNLIPKIATSFIYDRKNTSFAIGVNNFIERVEKQKEGLYIDLNDNPLKFYYFSYNKKEKLVLNKKLENYDYLVISFTNQLENIVTVSYEYDNIVTQYLIEKKYQYVNAKWIEILK